ncbi:hypothetical protein C4D60_Mb03t21130 [Musa balbisiana]|uniref:Auxin-responsive protein n=1 Tax=Musa balbisiana TaxID=52838 RepID=A0A4S8JDX4_MUSBA|nr:hypothetical protein C4D60_Mb03t21130 [Musa balbisiana]
MQEKEEKKRRKVKKGWLTVTVGTEVEAGGFRRFVIPISYLYHPLFTGLLDSARDTYGFPSSGPLALPCSVDDFLHLRWLIERETQPSVSALTGRMRDRLIGCLSLSCSLFVTTHCKHSRPGDSYSTLLVEFNGGERQWEENGGGLLGHDLQADLRRYLSWDCTTVSPRRYQIILLKISFQCLVETAELLFLNLARVDHSWSW